MAYKGWSNYNTWLVVNYIEQVNPTVNEAKALARAASTNEEAGQAIMDWIEDISIGFVRTPYLVDIVQDHWSKVNLSELGQHYRQDAGISGRRRARKKATKKAPKRRKPTRRK